MRERKSTPSSATLSSLRRRRSPSPHAKRSVNACLTKSARGKPPSWPRRRSRSNARRRKPPKRLRAASRSSARRAASPRARRFRRARSNLIPPSWKRCVKPFSVSRRLKTPGWPSWTPTSKTGDGDERLQKLLGQQKARSFPTRSEGFPRRLPRLRRSQRVLELSFSKGSSGIRAFHRIPNFVGASLDARVDLASRSTF